METIRTEQINVDTTTGITEYKFAPYFKDVELIEIIPNNCEAIHFKDVIIRINDTQGNKERPVIPMGMIGPYERNNIANFGANGQNYHIKNCQSYTVIIEAPNPVKFQIKYKEVGVFLL